MTEMKWVFFHIVLKPLKVFAIRKKCLKKIVQIVEKQKKIEFFF